MKSSSFTSLLRRKNKKVEGKAKNKVMSKARQIMDQRMTKRNNKKNASKFPMNKKLTIQFQSMKWRLCPSSTETIQIPCR